MRLGGAKRLLERTLARRGYRFVQIETADQRAMPAGFGEDIRDIFERVRDYTMTSPERVAALHDAVRYVVAAGIPGAVVECGVFRGGSMMAVAHTLHELGREDRDLYLYDTFTGPPPPSDRDFDLVRGMSVAESHARAEARIAAGEKIPTALQLLPLDEIRRLMLETGYPAERIHFVKGLVEETIPGTAPDEIAILRLDTDHYSSTKHELMHLYPRVSDGGVVIIDDYGRFKGSRDATDEFLAEQGLSVLMHRIDAASRMIIVRRR
ncbi:MAG TPA: TylF/MycF/NovP-related O-methyltransferase [Actinomycetota bacterium]|nr:TylF/MycF/NovP-related O-methyltransferase [Actinomycetota bacterium]